MDEAPGLRKRTADISTHLKFLLESQDPNTVFWIATRTLIGLGEEGIAVGTSSVYAASLRG